MNKALLLATYFFVNVASAGAGVHAAFVASGISKTDSLEVKIDKALILLNEKRYFMPAQPFGKLPPPFDISYQLDSLRTADQILEQKIGGNCGSSARAFAAILGRAGVSDADMQIVESVTNKDLAIICPKVGVARVADPMSGASGHVFVALRFPNGKWKIINSIDGSRTYGRADWISPDEVQRRMKTEAVAVPFEAFKTLPASTYATGLTVFQSWKPSQAPQHTFEQRYDLIASGDLKKAPAICRFTSATPN